MLFHEHILQILLWYTVPNVLLNMMCTFWLSGILRERVRQGERIAVKRWLAYSFLVGCILPFVTGPMASFAYHDALRRRHRARLWLCICTVLSFLGFIAYRVYDDAHSRGDRASLWSAVAVLYYGALVLLFPLLCVLSPTVRVAVAPKFLLATIPCFLLALVLFRVVHALCRTRLDYALLRARLEAAGRLQPMGGSQLVVEGLKTHFPIRHGVFSTVGGYVKAVDGIDLTVRPGECVGLVGESGCGKTTAGRSILGLVQPTAGRVLYEGIDLGELNGAEMRAVRSQAQVIFQDPIGSLNPRMTVGAIVSEGMAIHGMGTHRERREKTAKLLEKVGLGHDALNRFPHEFSGGQRQRIGIARALAVGARFIVCDEPVSALDVSIQAEIINLLQDLQSEDSEQPLAYLFIAHDLAVVEHISDRVAVMYLGKIVEFATRDELYGRPLHPYTEALLAAIPVADPGRERTAIRLSGELPSPSNPPSGCRFRTRCPKAVDICAQQEPSLQDCGDGHFVACLFVGASEGADTSDITAV